MKLYKFYNNFCGPCKLIAPLIDSYKDVVDIIPIDTRQEENHSLIAQYGVRGVPTIILDAGDKTVKLVGASEITKRVLDLLLR